MQKLIYIVQIICEIELKFRVISTSKIIRNMYTFTRSIFIPYERPRIEPRRAPNNNGIHSKFKNVRNHKNVRSSNYYWLSTVTRPGCYGT